MNASYQTANVTTASTVKALGKVKRRSFSGEAAGGAVCVLLVMVWPFTRPGILRLQRTSRRLPALPAKVPG